MRRVGLPFATALLLAGPFCFGAITESDTGFHVAVGRLILEAGIPHTNGLSWAYGDHPWYPTSWLFDALVAVAPSALGLQVVTFLLLGLALLGLAFAAAREGAAWVIVPIALLLQPRIVPRPHLASWALLTAMLALGPKSTKVRAWCVLLVAVGGNLHSGAAFGAFVLGLHCLDAYVRTRRRIELLIALGAGLALLANPGGPYILRYLYEHLFTVSELVPVRELAPPSGGVLAAFLVLAVASLLIAVKRVREHPVLLVATVVFAVLGLRSQRMVTEAQLVFAPSLAWALARAPLRAVFPATALAVLLVAASLRFDRLLPLIPFAARWDERIQPVRAVRFLDEAEIVGPGFNSLRDGGYLAYARPGKETFVDGRLQAVPPRSWKTFDAAERTPAAFQAYLRSLGCEWALVPRIREHLSGFRLLDGPEWALVYWDEVSEVFVRRDVPRFAGVREKYEYRHFRPYGEIVGTVASLARQDLPVLLSELDRFERTSPKDPFALLDRCAALTRLRDSAAGRTCDEASAHAEGSVVELVARARALPPAP